MSILFESDWARFPTATPHMSTKNESWVRLAAVYKSMGIKNCYFHLALLQPELADVDPRDPNLTQDQKVMIAQEIRWNIWYYLREVVRLPNGDKPLMLQANRGIISMVWCFMCCLDVGLVMPRQLGKSIAMDCLITYLMNYIMRKQELFLFTKDTDLRKRNIQRLKDIRDLHPTWLNPISNDDLDNTEALTVNTRGMILRTAVAQSQKDRAANIGRGMTIPAAFIDEAAFIANIEASLKALLPATVTAAKNVAALGWPHGNVISTTAGKLDSKEGAYIHSLLTGAMYVNETILFACKNKADVHDTVAKNSPDGQLMVNCSFNHRQLGLTDAELEEMILKAKSTGDDADRDYRCKWTHGTARSPLSTQLNNVIMTSIKDPVHSTVSNDRYIMNWHVDEVELEHRMETRYHIIGLDTSEAVGRDPNSLVICDAASMEVIGLATVNDTNLNRFALWIGELLIKYPNTVLVPENKSSASTILDIIAIQLENIGIDIYRRVYSKVVDNCDSMPKEYESICEPVLQRSKDISTAYRKYLGFKTNGTSRKFLYGTVFMEAAQSTGHLLKDRTLCNEITALEETNGRIDHPDGGHDDCVFAWMLCHWFVRYSKNLAHYGLDRNKTLSLVSTDGALLTEEEMAVRRELGVIRSSIAELKERLMGAPTKVDEVRYLRLLTNQVQKAEALGETTYSIDNIMEEVRERGVSRRTLRDSVRAFQRKRNAA